LTVFQSIPVDAAVLVTTPQELVGMIVEKAMKMIDMMHIPALGIVENMSYVQCPDCDKKIEIFGESHVDQLAAAYHIPHAARLPMDPKLSSGCDKGLIELFTGAWLDELAEAIADAKPLPRE
ncbi:MAG TPA: P-loop NTPase, partial [Candidatus Limiplasma sp.]|nr:P-loop NTPase [Candidatus Limiplasma sp.]